MTIRWTRAGLEDLGRLYEFLKAVNPVAAASVVYKLANAPDLLIRQPRIGSRLPAFEPREVRYLLVGDYELRYEVVTDGDIWILRLWHTREHR